MSQYAPDLYPTKYRNNESYSIRKIIRPIINERGHQIRRPEPDGQRQLRAVHYRARGYRGLLAAGGALPGERLARKLPALVVAARRAAEPVRPARVGQIRRTRPLICKAVLKLDERARAFCLSGRHHKIRRRLAESVRR